MTGLHGEKGRRIREVINNRGGGKSVGGGTLDQKRGGGGHIGPKAGGGGKG